MVGLCFFLRLRMWPEQSRVVAVSRAYSVSVTCSVAMLWKKLISGPSRSSPPPVHRYWKRKSELFLLARAWILIEETSTCSSCVPTHLSWATSCRGSFALTVCLWTSGEPSGWIAAALWNKSATGINIKRKNLYFYGLFLKAIIKISIRIRLD